MNRQRLILPETDPAEMGQLTLFDERPPPWELWPLPAELTAQEKWEIFHANNPQVGEELRRMALNLKARGRSHYGMRALIEVLRFNRAIDTSDPDYKLNNNYTPFYARWLMDTEPALEGFFEIRSQGGDDGG